MAIFKKYQRCWVSCARDPLWVTKPEIATTCLPAENVHNCGPEPALKQPWFSREHSAASQPSWQRPKHHSPPLLKSQNHFIFTKDWTNVTVTPRFLGVVTSKFFPTQLLSKNRETCSKNLLVFSAELDSYGPPAPAHTETVCTCPSPSSFIWS